MTKPNKAKNILDMIRERQQKTCLNLSKIGIQSELPDCEWQTNSETCKTTPYTPLNADQWQKFKRDFIEEYGGEPVQPTGMTHSDFIKYLTDGTRESGKCRSLKELLKDLKK